MQDRLFSIIPGYEALDAARRNPGDRLFVSDYHGGHPFVDEYLGDLAVTALPDLGDITRYAAVDEDLALRSRIADFHGHYDGVQRDADEVLAGGGSSMLISSFCTWLALSGVKAVHYVPPVYYKFAYLFRQFGIRPQPVADVHAFQPDFRLHLPDEKTVLVLTDPIWYTGRTVPIQVLDEIRAWQAATGSLVFVDNTFAYMQWDGTLPEAAARLDRDRTIRMICPTKFLSLHGYRCAWLLVPRELRTQLSHLHLNLHGEISLADRVFAHRACEVMIEGGGNGKLLRYVQDNYQHLLDKGALTDTFEARTGYFVFGRPRIPRERLLTMGQDFFELTGYPDHVRINLLNTTALEAL
ncbi:pyridoxal phosphate-dependent aminotransferase [Saccharopolyspora sp. NPDC000359]|uniref:pyridoxal phosphate-dependent aminotransferase n=1 Tax=Saccharopolyspora sp. NPDC000359 TaxID=3154251 RepID=UPI003318335C